jgi:sugar-phosphatase
MRAGQDAGARTLAVATSHDAAELTADAVVDDCTSGRVDRVAGGLVAMVSSGPG